MKKSNSEWRDIKTARKQYRREIDLWMKWGASPMTMGMADSFRVSDAYWKDDGWYHFHEGKEKKLATDYITHWMPKPKPPKFK